MPVIGAAVARVSGIGGVELVVDQGQRAAWRRRPPSVASSRAECNAANPSVRPLLPSRNGADTASSWTQGDCALR
jgi:hypothetical protein